MCVLFCTSLRCHDLHTTSIMCHQLSFLVSLLSVSSPLRIETSRKPDNIVCLFYYVTIVNDLYHSIRTASVSIFDLIAPEIVCHQKLCEIQKESDRCRVRRMNLYFAFSRFLATAVVQGQESCTSTSGPGFQPRLVQ